MKFQGKNLIIYCERAHSPVSERVDVVVSTKISKKAVVRNRLRRQIKEIIRHYRKQDSPLARDLKVVALPQILESKFSEIKQDLEDVLNRIK